nr:hypothetical protein [Gordonia sp. LAM0048]
MSVSPEDGENTVSPVDAPAPDSATAPDAEQLAALFDTSPEAGLLAVLEAVRGRNPEMARSLRAILADPERMRALKDSGLLDDPPTHDLDETIRLTIDAVGGSARRGQSHHPGGAGDRSHRIPLGRP